MEIVESILEYLDCMSIIGRAKRKIILVDLDNTLVDTERQFVKFYKKLYPGRPILPLNERSTFYFADEEIYSRRAALRTLAEPGFFSTQEPLPLALESLRELDRLPNVDVRICTSAIGGNKYPKGTEERCHEEKKIWTKQYLGEEWLEKLIITPHKYEVEGDVLIDDRPNPARGKENLAPWKHIIFTRPANKDLTGMDDHVFHSRLNGWREWRKVLEPFIN